MKYCEDDGLRYTDDKTKCTVCGRPLVDIAAAKDLPANTAYKLIRLCCPSLTCETLVASSSKAKFCEDCGERLQPISYELWVDKYVKQALEKRPAEVLLDPTDLLRPVAQMGLARDEATKRLDALLEERTGVSREVLKAWVDETSDLLKQEDKFEAAQQHAIRQAKKLNIPFLDAAVILEQLARRYNISFDPAAPAPPATEPPLEDRPVIARATRATTRVYKLRKREFTHADSYTDPLLGSARSFYRNLARGGSVSRNLTYLSLEEEKRPAGPEHNGDVYLREVRDPNGAFVLFATGGASGWVFPNPRRTDVRADVKAVFPHLTQAEFERAKADIGPVPVTRVSDSRWKINIDIPSAPRVGRAEGPAAAPTRPAGEKTPPSPEHAAAPETQPGPAPSTTPAPPDGTDTARLRKILLAVGIPMALLIGVLILATSSRRDLKEGDDISPAAPPAPPGMVYVPGGEFTMGNNAGTNELERPEHSVRLAPFFIDQYEVTCGQYAEYARATGHRLPGGWESDFCPPGSPELPVRGVSWYDANAYAKWARKRLPTEEEWELAARGYDKRLFPWGDAWEPNAANAGVTSAAQPVKVGSNVNGRSPFNAYDMVGNVWEWTASDLASYDPNGPLPSTLANGQHVARGKVIRGGSWESSPGDAATTTFRTGYPPRGKNYSKTGFRCAADVPSQ